MPPRIRSRNAPAREGVFISYARSDGDKVATDLRERLSKEDIPLWQDLVAMEGGRDWWLQITDALDHVEFMALVITPNALKSETVRKEWRYARQEGVCVYPIKGTPDLDLATLPRWLRDKHIHDIANQQQWRKFLNDLNSPCRVPRVPFMVEDLPADFVARPEEFEQLLAYLCNSKDGGPIAITAALRGAGGYGKTTLAKALCHNEDVQDAFEDGILWVTLGEKPGDLTGRVADLVETLSGERPGFSDVNAGAVRLRELLADRDVLLVIDDVWDAAHLTPFMQGSGRGARLITTRNIDTLPRNSKRVDVDAMRRDEAVALLGAGLSGIDGRALRALAARLGEWPLLLGIVSGALRHRVDDLGQDTAGALHWVNTALERRGLTAFDAHNPQAREQAVKTTLEVSIELLAPHERERYGELAVFPEDVEVPLTTLTKLWSKTGGLDEFESETLSERLDRLSLLQSFDPTRRVIRLHDVVRQYLIGMQGTRLPDLHDALLDAHRPSFGVQAPDWPLLANSAADGTSPANQVTYRALGDWAELPPDDLYLWDYLAYHLREAKRADELILTAKDLRYLAAKTVARNAQAVEQDLLDAEKIGSADAVLGLLRRRFVQSVHVFDNCEKRRDAEASLLTRMINEVQLAPLATVLAEALRPSFLAPLHQLPDLPDPELVRTLTGHSHSVNGCALSSDGTLIVSCDDQNVRVWEVASGKLLRKLGERTAWVRGCTISADRTIVVLACDDKTVKVWGAASGRLLRTLRGHAGLVNGCALSDDQTLIVSASADQTLKVWDAASGALLRTLSGHRDWVNGCAMSADGRLVVSASYDHTLKVWDAASGALLRTLRGHTDRVNGCAMSADGRLVASVSAWHDGTVRVWDAASGALLRTLSGHTGNVNGCAMSCDGTVIVSVSDDHTVKVWDSESGAVLRTLSGHTGWVWDCAISSDGTRVVSASADHTVRVWEVTSGAPSRTPSRHTGVVHDCAISGDGTRVVSASHDRTVKVWEVASGALLRTLSGHTGVVWGCAISGDGTRVVSASDDRTVKVWEVASGALLRTLTGHTDHVMGCALSGDGMLIVSASFDHTVKVWDLATGAVLHTLSEHTGVVRKCVLSVDDTLIVSASDDQTVKVWDSKSGALLRTLRGHTDGVMGCAISSDGTLIVSASADQTVKVWDSESGALLRTLRGHCCAISSDGTLIVSASGRNTVKAWDCHSGECLATLHVDGPLGTCAIHGNGDLIVVGGTRGIYFLRLVR